MTATIPFAPVEEALDDLRRGHFVLVADHDGPDSYGDVLVAAEHATADAINFLATEARGILYLALTEERCEELLLAPMVHARESASWLVEGQRWKRALRVMVDAREGITTGISAADRARTVALALDPASRPDTLVVPGHMQPLAAHPDGILGVPGRNEAFVALPELAGLTPAGVASAVMTDDGAVATVADAAEWCAAHGIKIVTVGAVQTHAARRTEWLERLPPRTLQTSDGRFSLIEFVDPIARVSHRAVVFGTVAPGAEMPVVVIGACVEGDVFGQRSCRRRGAAQRALAALADQPVGILVHVDDGARCCVGPRAPGVVEHAWEAAARILDELGANRIVALPGHGEPLTPLEPFGFSLGLPPRSSHPIETEVQ
jgi:3,4-dihydroxy 2-butanone 4-phosphate synthase / GTP cyclohydrolase II